MPTPINTAADLRPWRGRLAWTQARAATELRIHLVSYKRLEACRAEASGTLLRLAEMLELHHAATTTANPVAAAEPRPLVSAPTASETPSRRTAFGTPFGRLRRPATPAPAPVPTPPTPSDADLALEDAFDIFDIPAIGRPFILAEIERQRIERFGSRRESGPTDRQLCEEAEDCQDAWGTATDDARDLTILAKLVAEAADIV